MLPPRTLLGFLVLVQVWVMLLYMANVTAEGHVDVWKSELPLESMLMSVVSTEMGDYTMLSLS